jgi:D-alanine-D-alanine ligase
MDIVVLAGGLSPERDVSLSSGCMIANALIGNGNRVLLADVYMGLGPVCGFSDAYNKYKKDKYTFTVPEREPDLEVVKRSRVESAAGTNGAALIGEGILNVCADAGMTFNALHGDIGENGQLQAVFDVYGIKYTGTGYQGSFLAMDKPLAKELMRGAGILTPDWYIYNNGDSDILDIQNNFDLPWVIKPCGCGSSIGVSIVNNIDEFSAAVKYAYIYEKKILVERKITGREFSVGVLGGEALPPIEIIPCEGFYDYKNKYQPGATLEICPPKGLAREAEARMRDTALKVHNLLRLGDYSRLDLILSEDGHIYCLETNTLPGMTPTSLIPQEAAAAGITYAQLCGRIVELALARYK